MYSAPAQSVRLLKKTAIGYVKKYAEANDIQARQGFLESLAKGVTGVKNTTGQHPGGIMVCPRDMDVHEFTPVQYPANKKRQWHHYDSLRLSLL